MSKLHANKRVTATPGQRRPAARWARPLRAGCLKASNKRWRGQWQVIRCMAVAGAATGVAGPQHQPGSMEESVRPLEPALPRSRPLGRPGARRCSRGDIAVRSPRWLRAGPPRVPIGHATLTMVRAPLTLRAAPTKRDGGSPAERLCDDGAGGGRSPCTRADAAPNGRGRGVHLW